MPCFSYYLLGFSSTKLEKRAEQVLPGNEGGGGGEGLEVQGREMVQTIYTHMNKCINN
jgi:hypothetical protein